MIIGVGKVLLHFDECYSLKDKRQIVKSLIGRIKSRFNVSVAEVDLNDLKKEALIGLSCISNTTKHADSTLSTVINFIENDTRLMVVDVSTECITDN